MLLEAPVESTLAAFLVLFGMTYTAHSILDSLIRRARNKSAELPKEEQPAVEA